MSLDRGQRPDIRTNFSRLGFFFSRLKIKYTLSLIETKQKQDTYLVHGILLRITKPLRMYVCNLSFHEPGAGAV